MKRTLSLFVGLASFLAAHSALSDVVINEIYYHPTSTNLLEQWVELHNSGGSPVDISGWRLTQDVSLQFPTPTILPASGFLVIAADAATFGSLHPKISPLAAGWVGCLSHTIELSDALGKSIQRVDFYSQGDWATRVMGAEMYKHRGWEWSAAHDGAGASLELVNPHLNNDHPLNWTSSRNNQPTPGQPNSAYSTNAAPLIGSVRHAPVLPKPSDTVTISTRVTDDLLSGVGVQLHWRVDGQPAFTQATMFDDGLHNDGLAADGIFAAAVPPHSQGVVVEFFITAQDAQGQERVYPLVIPLENSLRTANLLYQVDAATYSGTQPVYRLIMTERERAELYALGRICPDSDSDASMNATWITQDSIVSGGTTTQMRYNASVRNRGHGSRVANPNNYHVNVPSDRPWKDQLGINLNSQYAYSQVLGSAIFRVAGVPMANARPVQVRVNSTNLMTLPTVNANSFGSYSANEQYNNSFIKRSFPLDPAGNSYRGIRDSVACDPKFDSVADLVWHGTDPKIGSYTNAYFKQNHATADDWSDLISLLGVLNLTHGTTAKTYIVDVERVINVAQWMRYMALNTLLDNNETILANGIGDDYALYRGVQDPRFVLLPYDLDTLMGRGLSATSPRDGIFRMTNLPVIDRFMKTPQFAPLYFKSLRTLADSLFSSAEMNPLIDQTLSAFVPKQQIDNMKAFNASHVAYVLSQFPQTLTVTSSLSVGAGGYLRSTSPTTSLSGTANAIDTRFVRVNGRPTDWIAWRGTWSLANLPLHPGINRFTIESLNERNQVFEETSIDIWCDTTTPKTVGGTLTANTTWSPASGPYQITSTLTVANGTTLTIAPGTSIFLSSGVNLVVSNGGIILADGTAQDPIWISAIPGASSSWGGITINGTVNSPETRFSYLTIKDNGTTAIEVAGGTLALDHAVFLTTTYQYVSLDDSSFVLSHCTFPSSTAAFELVHGTGGIKSGGRGIVRDSFFGRSIGYNDIVDFTGGNRPNQAIIQFLNNVFSGATDDQLDLDGTDAWIEGNIFLHCHRNGSPDSSSAISGGNSGSNTSQITAIGNLFFDCDQAATTKEGNFYILLNNTIVHTTKEGGLDNASGVVNVRDFPNGGTPTDFGQGCYLEANIILDAELLARNYDPTQVQITWTNNILPKPWSVPGSGNRVIDPMLKHIPTLAETQFKTWAEAQILREWFSLRPGSPALGTGPSGLDQGGIIPFGLAITGEPQGRTSDTSARLNVSSARTGYGIPVAGFPQGSGYTHYRWSLDQGPWSAETPTTQPIVLQSLVAGEHSVQVIGKLDSGHFQNNPEFGTNALITTSLTWTVDPNLIQLPTVRLNELLARNSTTYTNAATTPDLVELYNYGTLPVDLSGFGLSGRGTNTPVFRFPPNTLLPAGGYLVLLADSDMTKPGQHLGFGLNQNGDTLNLIDRAVGAAVLDTITFGLQVADLSLSRTADGSWTLGQPTFGAANIVASLGDPTNLRINEWLTTAQFNANNNFIELLNPSILPVALGGLYLSDAAGALNLHAIAPLSYMRGQVSFIADGSLNQGANHLPFKLSPDVGLIALSSPTLEPIDIISYGPQHTDISEGRKPDGSEIFAFFNQPTPGAPNPGVSNSPNGTVTNVTSLVTSLVLLTNSWHYDQTGLDLGTYWSNPSFNDSLWATGKALFYHGKNPTGFPLPVSTTLNFNPSQQATYYFRTHFNYAGTLQFPTFNLSHIIDDGAVVYLNGTEIYRTGLPTGTINYTTLATTTVSDASQKGPYAPSTLKLITGDNVLAVEVHQSSLTSSDIAMALALDVLVSSTNIVNSGSVSTPILLNEILVRNRTFTNRLGQVADWLELFNPSTNRIDLSDISLTTDLANVRQWVFATGTTLAADSLLVLACNPNLPINATNTGFSLKYESGTIFLFDVPARGGALLDSLRYGPQIPDYSVARVPNGSTTWVLAVPTEGTLNMAAGLGSASDLRINEWMANSSDGNDWFELFNASTLPVELSGLHLSDKLDQPNKTTIPPLSYIGINANAFLRFEADASPNNGPTHANFKLSSKGETIGLFSPDGTPINAVSFGPQALNTSTGFLPDGSTNRESFTLTMSPDARNYLPIPQALINEVLTHSDPPTEDAIEFYNPTASTVDIGGWYLSNTQDDLRRYKIPTPSLIAPGAFLVLYQNQFGTAFTFNSAHGDDVYLSTANLAGDLTGFRNHASFPAAARGVSFGRVPTSVGVDFAPLARTTFGRDNATTLQDFRTGVGQTNSAPLVGPVVINELMIQPIAPPGMNPADLEFIELANSTSDPIPLFDPAIPTHTWRLDRGVRYSFPTNITLLPKELILILPFDPLGEPELTQNLIRTYAIPAKVRLFGPYSGQLSDQGDTLELLRADAPQQPPHPDAGFVPYLIVDQLSYGILSPWPNPLLTPGSSLHKVDLALYANDPAHWKAESPTAGISNILPTPNLDSDLDGMPDSWERDHNLDPNNLADAQLDADSDGLTNVQEFLAGTDPHNVSSRLGISAELQADGLHLTFSTIGNHTYEVQFQEALGGATWQTLQEVKAPSNGGALTILDPTVGTTRFYRLRLVLTQ